MPRHYVLVIKARNQQTIVYIVVGIVVIGLVAVGGWWLLSNRVPVEVTPVTVRLKWLHQAQFAGMYMAQEQGFYRKSGLDVMFLEPNFEGPDSITEVAGGDSDFTIVDPFQLLTSIDEGAPVKAVAAIFQESPAAFASLAKLNISTPSDFEGHTVGVPGGFELNQLIASSLLKLQGIDSSVITYTAVGFNNVENLVNQKADIVPLYRTSDPYLLDQQGTQYDLLLPERFGFASYDDVLITSEQLIATNPKLVQRFVAATIKGWEYALEHSDEAVAVSLQYSTAPEYQDTAYQRFIFDQGASLIKPTGGQTVGSMSFTRWQRLQNIMEGAGLLKRPLNASDIYTTEFLP